MHASLLVGEQDECPPAWGKVTVGTHMCRGSSNPQVLKAHINALDVEVMNPDEVANEVCSDSTNLSVFSTSM